MSLMKLTTSALAIAALSATTAAARDQVQVAGSSTVLPYASIVAEAFGENFDFPTPVVESGGSSAGLKRFCEGVGENARSVKKRSQPVPTTASQTSSKSASVTMASSLPPTSTATPSRSHPKTGTKHWPPSISSTASWSQTVLPHGIRLTTISPRSPFRRSFRAPSTAHAKFSRRK